MGIGDAINGKDSGGNDSHDDTQETPIKRVQPTAIHIVVHQ
jgi:hypothetical protein